MIERKRREEREERKGDEKWGERSKMREERIMRRG